MNESATESRWRTSFRILWGGQFFTIAGLMGITPFLPFYMQQLGVDDTQTNLLWSGVALAAPALSYALTAPLWGKLGDSWSRKWMVVRSLLGLSISLLLMGVAQTPVQFFLARLCQGAFGGIYDASAAFIGSQAPHKRQGEYLGKFQNGIAAGSLIGPLISGILADQWGFRPMLLFTGAVVGGCAILASLFLREFNQEAKQSGQQSPGVWKQMNSMLQDPRLRTFLVGGIAAKFGVFGLVTVYGPFVSGLIPHSQAQTTWIGLMDAAVHVGTLLGSSWWGKKNDRGTVEKNFVVSAGFCGLVISMQALLPFLAWLFVLRVLQGFFFCALIQSVMLVVMRTSQEYNRGLRTGIANSLLVTGQLAGSIAGGFLGGFLPLHQTVLGMGSVFMISSAFVGGMVLYIQKKGRVTSHDVCQ